MTAWRGTNGLFKTPNGPRRAFGLGASGASHCMALLHPLAYALLGRKSLKTHRFRNELFHSVPVYPIPATDGISARRGEAPLAYCSWWPLSLLWGSHCPVRVTSFKYSKRCQRQLYFQTGKRIYSPDGSATLPPRPRRHRQKRTLHSGWRSCAYCLLGSKATIYRFGRNL